MTSVKYNIENISKTVIPRLILATNPIKLKIENTANKIVKRDSNGGFASGAQIVQAISKTEGSFSAVQEVFQIKITSGAVKWYIAISATDELQFRNASGVIAAVLDQSGNLKVKGEVTAHDTSI